MLTQSMYREYYTWNLEAAKFGFRIFQSLHNLSSPLWRESPDRFPSTRSSDTGLWCFIVVTMNKQSSCQWFQSSWHHSNIKGDQGFRLHYHHTSWELIQASIFDNTTSCDWHRRTHWCNWTRINHSRSVISPIKGWWQTNNCNNINGITHCAW